MGGLSGGRSNADYCCGELCIIFSMRTSAIGRVRSGIDLDQAGSELASSFREFRHGFVLPPIPYPKPCLVGLPTKYDDLLPRGTGSPGNFTC